MRLAVPWLIVLGAVTIPARAQSSDSWQVARSEHFEVYSQSSGDGAQLTLAWLENLRAFLTTQTGFKLDGSQPVRVIGFRSPKEYQPYRLTAAADAYYAGTEGRDYIVMSSLDPSNFGIAAHEYAHLVLHATRLTLPPWLSEGLAELFSTVRVSERGSTLGGDLPGRMQELRRHAWIPLADLLVDSTSRDDRERAGRFYAQSWILTEMLVLSPAYGPRFPALIPALSSGKPSADVLTSVYQTSLETIERDLRDWADRSRPKIPVAGVVTGVKNVSTSAVSPFAARFLLADLLMTAGQLDRADRAFRDLAREDPADADVYAALGTVALRKDDRDEARRNWKQAIEKGIADPTLCFRYAVLAMGAGLPADEIRPALEKAVALKPDFDDARYNLALLEKSASHYEIAIRHFRAMKEVNGERAYSYWIALADSLNELGRREEAKAAARNASQHASNDTERAHAAQLAYLADTDLTVQLTRDANGRSQMVTARAPHGTSDWNAFIEPTDDIRRVQGKLRAIECDQTETRIRVQTASGSLTLSIPDPSRVLMRNAPPEFVCGPQKATEVSVDYAASKNPGAKVDGIVRGMDFR